MHSYFSTSISASWLLSSIDLWNMSSAPSGSIAGGDSYKFALHVLVLYFSHIYSSSGTPCRVWKDSWSLSQNGWNLVTRRIPRATKDALATTNSAVISHSVELWHPICLQLLLHIITMGSSLYFQKPSSINCHVPIMNTLKNICTTCMNFVFKERNYTRTNKVLKIRYWQLVCLSQSLICQPSWQVLQESFMYCKSMPGLHPSPRHFILMNLTSLLHLKALHSSVANYKVTHGV